MWLLLAAAMAAAQGAQYDDYGAVKMPAYGEYEAGRERPRDEYRRPPPASPDLYEEENKAITQISLSKDYGNVDSWQKPLRKQTKRGRSDEEYEGGDARGRPPRAGRGARRPDARAKHKRDDGKDDNDEEFSIEKYIRGINENNLEVDVTHSSRRPIDRIVHRKPRDRDEGKEAGAVFREEDFDEDLRVNPAAHVPSPLEDPYVSSDRDELQSEEMWSRARSHNLDVLPVESGRRRGEAGRRREPEEPPRLRPAQRARLEPGAGADYDRDYYDVRRLQGARKKPPAARRHPQVSAEDWEPSPLKKLKEIENRRLMAAGGRSRPLLRSTVGRPAPRRRTSPRPHSPPSSHPPEASAPPSSTSPTAPATSHTPPAASTTAVAVVTTSAVPTLTFPKTGTKELSLAEKSRLSILKKAGHKEREKGGPPSTKPPVLLQVTRRLPTVVLVEASTAGDPWLRARQVRADSPENLARVRQLMRQKLVANAKDIRDLTEDWDQLVCDYVDVALLKNRVPLFRSKPENLLVVATYLLAWLMI